jgi:hypothetical protein
MLRWCTERRRVVVEFWLGPAMVLDVLARLIRRAWTHYCWEGRPSAWSSNLASLTPPHVRPEEDTRFLPEPDAAGRARC